MQASKGSNTPLNNPYVDDIMKECIKMMHILEHEKMSENLIDVESRFASDKMIEQTIQIICFLEKCQKCIDGMSKKVYRYRELQRRFIE